MEAAGATADRERGTGALRGVPGWVLGVVPLLLIVASLGAFLALGAPGVGERRGPPVEQLAVERTKLVPGTIELTVRNDGPDAVSIAQVDRQRRVRLLQRRRAADRAPGDARR